MKRARDFRRILIFFLSSRRKMKTRKMNPKRGKFEATQGPSLKSQFQNICLGSMSIWISQILKNMAKLLRSHAGIQERHFRITSYSSKIFWPNDLF